MDTVQRRSCQPQLQRPRPRRSKMVGRNGTQRRCQIGTPWYRTTPFSVCACLCLCMCVFELNDLPPIYLARWFILTPSRSSLKAKVTGQSLKNKENKSLATAKMANLCRKGDLNWKLQVSNSRAKIFQVQHRTSLTCFAKTVAKVIGATSSDSFLSTYPRGVRWWMKKG